MAKTLIGRPAPGALVRDPDHDFEAVADELRAYPPTSYWRRRFAQGDMLAGSEADLKASGDGAAATAAPAETVTESETAATGGKRRQGS